MTTENSEKSMWQRLSGRSKLPWVSLFRWGTCIILLLLLCVSVWLQWQGSQVQNQQQALLQAFEARLMTYQQQTLRQFTQIERQKETLQQRLDQQMELLLQSQQQQAEQLRIVRQRLVRLSATQRQDWQLIEAQRLISAAGHQLWLLQDATAAWKLLQGASNLLVTLEDPALLPVHQALAEDSQQLAAVHSPDPEKLVMPLLDQLSQLERIPLKQSLSSVRHAVVSERAMLPWWLCLWQRGKLWLQSLIVIQRQSIPAEQALTSEAKNYREPLRVYLQLAVQAGLYRQYQQYRQALDYSLNWLKAYCDPLETSVSHLMTQIQCLQQQVQFVEFPKQLQSQILLEEFLQRSLRDISQLPTQQPVEDS